MKKNIITLLLLFFVFQSYECISQKNRVRFMVIPIYTTVVNFGYASFSYEYEITEHHTIGYQIHSNFAQVGDWAATRFSYNMNIYYRYYFNSKKKLKTFLVVEPGYYHLYISGEEEAFWSNNYTLSALYGIRYNFNSSGKWFMDISLGAAVVQRQYYKQSVEYSYEEGEPPLPKNKTLVLPRMIFEVGFRF